MTKLLRKAFREDSLVESENCICGINKTMELKDELGKFRVSTWGSISWYDCTLNGARNPHLFNE